MPSQARVLASERQYPLPLAGLALVTGGSGFIGSAVVRCLVGAGISVRAMIRPTSPRANLAGLKIDSVLGDLRDRDSLKLALRDVRYLFHVAADYRLWVRDPEEMIKTNVQGTRNIMQASLDAGVERVVYTSSVATFGFRSDGKPGDESLSLKPEDAIGTYKRSKILAEQLVLSLIEKQGLPAVIVNPTTPVGPRDIRPTPTGRIILETARGRMPGYVETGLNLVHVDDVAMGHLQAIQRGKKGERYILGGQNVELRQMIEEVARLAGRPAGFKMRIPKWPLYPIAFASEAAARFSKREPFLTRDGLRMASHHMFFTSQKANRELGYSARPYHQALADAVSWFQQAGYLQRS